MSKKKSKEKQIWLKDCERHDYPAGLDYLELLFPKKKCKEIIKALKKAKITRKKAKDIFRASRLPLLPETNVHVRENLEKIKRGEKLSPVLLVCIGGKLHIVDGYHRISCVYVGISEDHNIPCKLVHIN